MKNYIDIVLTGYINPDTRSFLKDYFVREQKKAADEGYSADEFFFGCLMVTEAFENDINQRYLERKNNLLIAKSLAKDEAKLQDIETELAMLAIDNFSVYLPGVTGGKYTGSLWLDEVYLIKKAAAEAYNAPTGNKTGRLTINQIALLHVYNGWQITQNNAKEIIARYGLTSGQKLYQQYSLYSSLANRTGRPYPDTKKKIQNKISLKWHMACKFRVHDCILLKCLPAADASL